MMRTLRTVGAVFVFVSGIGLVRAGLWFLEEAGRAEKVAGELAAEGAPPIIPESLYARAAMAVVLGLVLLGWSGRELYRSWRSGSRLQ